MSMPVERWEDRWFRKASAAVDDLRWGLEHPARDPVTAAIEMRSTLESKMAKKETWDKWEDRLKTVGKRRWYDRAPKLAPERYPRGIEAGRPEFRAFAEEFKPHLDRGLAEVRKMPRVTIEDSVNRAAYMIRHNAKFKWIPKG